MLIPKRQHNIGNSIVALEKEREREKREEGKNIGLELSDRDRYYFGRIGAVRHDELVGRNSMRKYIDGMPVSTDKIYGKHSVNPHNEK